MSVVDLLTLSKACWLKNCLKYFPQDEVRDGRNQPTWVSGAGEAEHEDGGGGQQLQVLHQDWEETGERGDAVWGTVGIMKDQNVIIVN